MSPQAQGNGRGRQRGASSLFITVILVLVVMLLAVTAAVLSGTQFKLAGNLQYENIAFNLAEQALVSAESWLSAPDGAGNPANSRDAGFATYTTGNYRYPIDYLASTSVDPLTMTWTDSNSLPIDADDAKRYLIEKWGSDNVPFGEGNGIGVTCQTVSSKVNIFRITTRGTSAKGTTKFVQSIFSVRSRFTTEKEC